MDIHYKIWLKKPTRPENLWSNRSNYILPAWKKESEVFKSDLISRFNGNLNNA